MPNPPDRSAPLSAFINSINALTTPNERRIEAGFNAALVDASEALGLPLRRERRRVLTPENLRTIRMGLVPLRDFVTGENANYLTEETILLRTQQRRDMVNAGVTRDPDFDETAMARAFTRTFPLLEGGSATIEYEGFIDPDKPEGTFSNRLLCISCFGVAGDENTNYDVVITFTYGSLSAETLHEGYVTEENVRDYYSDNFIMSVEKEIAEGGDKRIEVIYDTEEHFVTHMTQREFELCTAAFDLVTESI